MNLIERLLAKSEWQPTERSAEIGDCLVWTAGAGHFGHGFIWLAGHTVRVHRVAWIERHGEPPAETPLVLHHCDNPPCWRDEHLYLGTHADNARDRSARGRHRNQGKTHCPQDHAYTPENTGVDRGRRYCKTCKRLKRAARKARR